MGKTVEIMFGMFFMTLFFIYLFFHSPHTGYACSCAEPGTVKEELERSSAVFSGEVVEIVGWDSGKPIRSTSEPIAVIFEVEESWKGIDQTQITVYTAGSSASCGYEFTAGEKYLVYAQEDEDVYRVSLCSRTTLLSTAEKDINELGQGEKPTEQVDLNVIEDENVPLSKNIIYISLFIVGFIFVAVYIIWRIRKSNQK